MKKLKQNITNIYGAKGEHWLANLPVTIATLTDYWNLSEVIPVLNMTFNYVAKAILDGEQPVVLKISYDKKSIENEKQALMNLNSQGSIKLIDYNSKYNALLVQQAIPGITLKSLYPAQIDYVMDCYVQTMQKLHNKHLPKKQNDYHIADWLKALDTPTSKQIPAFILNRAIDLRNKLLSSLKSLVFLHGDLHHDNILKHGNAWLAIDPKGVVGEAEFEIAAFDFMYITELATTVNVKKIFAHRIDLLAQKSNLDAQRIKDWVFVRLVLMAAWLIEDNDDPSWAIKLATLLLDDEAVA
ncbi:aminoglycoside phosphotransferase family protein [Legionella bozemanae]|uniref:Aminoglycoside/hydroxyurea antibiotic resistance kinase n=1 Tax=Legionella bozemanae TaxID=447 RepID=A0A0W0RQQ0_LEGBO|nr:aminoglycoside phosphotransferase family protein [Legionella bozemanae]KTC73356.1 Aminoglycoside/hydroxyurea antibiotic resistance kinase [Legionella bozemanae]STO35625.1 Aminoglycoside phosphotransferase [Legionella bozemanae]